MEVIPPYSLGRQEEGRGEGKGRKMRGGMRGREAWENEDARLKAGKGV